MRKVLAGALLIVAGHSFCKAAVFECEFSPKGADQNGYSCRVDTAAEWKTEPKKCRQDYSVTLFGECAGRSPGGVNQLICYFANPASPPNLDVKSVIAQAGVYAVAIEWVSFPPSVGPIVLDYKDGQNARSISCAPNL